MGNKQNLTVDISTIDKSTYICGMEKLGSIFFYHLEKAIKTYRQYAQNKLKENGFSITIDQWLVLKVLSDNPSVTQNELAVRVFKDKASVTRIIEILVKERYLHRDFHENRRRYKLTITDKGYKVLKDIMPAVLKNRKKALTGLGPSEIAIAEKVLKAIAENCSR
jgi:MarR family transcriptional regulator, transcriptional regulator for hemolysin